MPLDIYSPQRQGEGQERAKYASLANALDYVKGYGASIPGDIADLVKVLAEAKQGQYPKELDAMGTMQFGEQMGADTDSGAFLAGNLGLFPDMSDALPALFAGVRSLKNLGSAKVMTSHGLKDAMQLRQDLDNAEKMAKQGSDPWQKYGWFQGADGKWRYEIDDTRATFNIENVPEQQIETQHGTLHQRSGKLNDGLSHEGINAAYPQMGENINLREVFRNNGTNGEYKPQTFLMPESIMITDIAKDKRSTALHEVQHAIQNREGFAVGGSPSEFSQVAQDNIRRMDNLNGDLAEALRELNKVRKTGDKEKIAEALGDYEWIMQEKGKLIGRIDPQDMYRSLAGEAEARAVQERKDWPLLRREVTHPKYSHDVPFESQIVQYK